MKWTLLQIAAVAFALLAALISFNLYSEHMTGKAPVGFLSLGCSADNEQSALDCRKVTQSRWAVWPFAKDGDPPNAKRLPVSMLGWAYYSMLAVWLIGVGRPSRSRRWLHLPALLLNGLGLCASAFFIYIMATRIDAWCTQCLATHVLNVLLFIALLWLWPRRTPATAPARNPGEPAIAAEPPHPSWRVLALTLAGMLLVYAFQSGSMIHPALLVNYKRLERERDEYRKVAETYRNDGKAAMDNWFRREGVAINTRPDDPLRTKAGQKPVRLVVFSDFECPQCAQAAQAITNIVEPLFDGYVQLTFKHYPLCTKCNQVTNNAHPNACDAAYAAEAARLQDADKFWEAHDWMFANQGKLSGLGTEQGARQLARRLKLDEDLLLGEMNSEDVANRVQEDIKEAKRLGVHQTPAVYMESSTGQYKLLHNYFDVKNPNFWRVIARYYWYDALKKEPPAAVKKLLEASDETAAPTPDTPGSTADP